MASIGEVQAKMRQAVELVKQASYESPLMFYADNENKSRGTVQKRSKNSNRYAIDGLDVRREAAESFVYALLSQPELKFKFLKNPGLK